jgi:hypothetical protein
MVVTAEEFLKSQNYPDSLSGGTLEQALKDFAELHRQECLKQASEKARKQFIPTGGNNGYFIVNKDSILNAYSKKNIR